MQIDYQVGIVGSGFGGLIAALELNKSGRNSFIIFERAAELGGVWRDNIYPGCACDVKSNLYSIATERNPDWSFAFSTQPEILQYLKDVAQKYGLEKHIRYNTKIVRMRFVEEHGCWEVLDQDRNRVVVTMMIMATGPQDRPYLPAIKGQETFKGAKFHSAAWDPCSDFTGKRVAIIGTGASSVQIVPQIAPIVARLLVFQRTAAWLIPRRDRKIYAFERWLYRYLPFVQYLSRGYIYWLMEVVGISFTGNPHMNRLLTKIALWKLRQEVDDSQTREKLTPDYKIGCKRILISDDFYPTFNRPNVELITEHISEITQDGIRTQDGQYYGVDAIVFATGFVVADIENYIEITGMQGRVLTDEWDRSGAEAYRGINVSGYPNLGFILGPNSGLSHSSALHVMESQMNYIMQYLEQLEKHGNKTYLDVKPEVQKIYNAILQSKFENTTWASGCKSWYINKNGKNTAIYPGLTKQYRKETRALDLNDYIVSAKVPA